jgi:hypothetical protein
MNRCRLADCGRRPGPFFTRRVEDNTTPKRSRTCCDAGWKPPRRHLLSFQASSTHIAAQVIAHPARRCAAAAASRPATPPPHAQPACECPRARCRPCGRSVSLGRLPNRTCPFPDIRLSTSPVRQLDRSSRCWARPRPRRWCMRSPPRDLGEGYAVSASVVTGGSLVVGSGSVVMMRMRDFASSSRLM